MSTILEDKYSRPLKQGDLVLFNNNNNGFKDIRYGIVVGESAIYSDGVYYRKVSTCFKINKPCDKELVIYNNLINSFQNDVKQKGMGDKGKEMKQIGGLYMQSNPHVYYLYLGSGKLYNINKKQIDESENIYLAISVSFNPDILTKTFDSESLYDLIKRELSFSLVELDSNKSLKGYNHLIFTNRDKKFIKQVGKIDISDNFFNNYLYLPVDNDLNRRSYLYLEKN